jgi:hypothetical protein
VVRCRRAYGTIVKRSRAGADWIPVLGVIATTVTV